MGDWFYYLNFFQVMPLIHAIDQLRENNPYFNDDISEDFENYVLSRTCEIASYLPIELIIKPNAKKYKVSKSMVEYLIRLTGINIFDKTIIKEYIQFAKEEERNLETKFLHSLRENDNNNNKKM